VAFFSSLKVKALRFGEDKISPSDLGVGRFEKSLASLYDRIDKLGGTDEGLVFEIPDAGKRGKELVPYMLEFHKGRNMPM